MNKIKESIQSNFLEYGIDDKIKIFDGRYCFYVNDKLFKCKGNLSYKIISPSAITFEAELYNTEENKKNLELLDTNEILIELHGYKPMNAVITNIQKDIIFGYISDNAISSKNVKADYIQFDIVNMDKFPGKLVKYNDAVYATRIEFELNDYLIQIDKSIKYKKEFQKELVSKNGSAITHTGRVYNKKGNLINTANIEKILDRLSLALSFMCGRYILIPNCYGYTKNDDLNKNEVFRFWKISDTSSYRFVPKWTSTISNYHNLEKFLSLMCKKLEQPYMENSLSSVIDWYLEAISSVSIAGSIVSVHTALEMLSYIVLVELKGVYSNDEYNKNPSNKNIREVLEFCGIDSEFKYKELYNENIFDYLYDQVDIITYLRNIMIHPSKNNKIEMNVEDMLNAISVAIHFVELIILRILGYKAEYTNRFSNCFFGEVELVPWV